ncbi:MarR family winged helix-turn-helix transcriptional regulator [Streptococcus equinus]|uniref:MarR family winged helix-turn-helix transcriptional regulator n=1 Tax=Streptococcus equinus TaxID=1335 RepID=UPI003BF8DE0E
MPKTVQEMLDSRLFFAIKKLNRALDKISEESFQKVGLSPSQSTILMILDMENGKLHKDLAKILGVTAPTLTRIIEKLVHKGLVEIICKGRTKHVYITDEGRKVIPSIQQAHSEVKQLFNRFVKNYPENLVEELNKITQQLKFCE